MFGNSICVDKQSVFTDYQQMHNEFGIPSDETEEIIRLRIELAKGKAKQQKLETVLQANNDLANRLQSITAEHQRTLAVLKGYHCRIYNLARIMKITLDSYNGAAIRQDCSQSMHLKETDEQFEPAEGKWLTAEELLLSIIAHKCQILLTKYEQADSKVKQLQQYPAKMGEIQAIIRQKVDSLKQFEIVLARKEIELQKLQQQNQQLKGQVSTITSSLENSKTMQQTLLCKLEEETLQLTKAQEQTQKCQGELSKYKRELSKCQEQLHRSQEQLQMCKEQLQRCQEQLQRWHGQLQSRREQLEQTKGEQSEKQHKDAQIRKMMQNCESIVKMLQLKEDDYIRHYLATSRDTVDVLTSSRRTKYELVFNYD